MKLTANSRMGLLYTFMFVASRADMDSQRKLENLDPAVLFEQLCADILLNFWGGKTELSGSLVFGTARKKAVHNSAVPRQYRVPLHPNTRRARYEGGSEIRPALATANSTSWYGASSLTDALEVSSVLASARQVFTGRII